MASFFTEKTHAHHHVLRGADALFFSALTSELVLLPNDTDTNVAP